MALSMYNTSIQRLAREVAPFMSAGSMQGGLLNVLLAVQN